MSPGLACESLVQLFLEGLVRCLASISGDADGLEVHLSQAFQWLLKPTWSRCNYCYRVVGLDYWYRVVGLDYICLGDRCRIVVIAAVNKGMRLNY